MSLWTLVANYCDETGATEAAVMRKAGLNKGTFSAWRARGVPALPHRAHVIGLAEALRVDYETVIMAILHDAKYLPESAARAEQQRVDEEDRHNWIEIRDMVVRLLTEAEGDAELAVQLANQRMDDHHRKKAPEIVSSSSVYLNAREYLRGELHFPLWLARDSETANNVIRISAEENREFDSRAAARRGKSEGRRLRAAQDAASEGSQDPDE